MVMVEYMLWSCEECEFWSQGRDLYANVYVLDMLVMQSAFSCFSDWLMAGYIIVLRLKGGLFYYWTD